VVNIRIGVPEKREGGLGRLQLEELMAKHRVTVHQIQAAWSNTPDDVRARELVKLELTPEFSTVAWDRLPGHVQTALIRLFLSEMGISHVIERRSATDVLDEQLWSKGLPTMTGYFEKRGFLVKEGQQPTKEQIDARQRLASVYASAAPQRTFRWGGGYWPPGTFGTLTKQCAVCRRPYSEHIGNERRCP